MIWVKYSINIYGGLKAVPGFDSVSNLFTPSTLDRCYQHTGQGTPGGIKTEDNEWNITGHRDRIITVAEKELSLFASLYDGEDTPALEAHLPALHTRQLLSVLDKFAAYPRKLADLGIDFYATQHWNETNAQNDGTIRRDTQFPESADQLIFSGPHIYTANPCYKTPRAQCNTPRAYDSLDITTLPDDYLPRTNYFPDCSAEEYHHRAPAVPWQNTDSSGELLPQKKVTDFYRYVSREMISQSGERTLTPCIIPKGSGHVHTCISIVLKNSREMSSFVGSALSIPLDYWIKTTGSGHANTNVLSQLPFITAQSILITRALSTNCLTTHYADLWAECWDAGYQSEQWLGDDARLDAGFWSNLTPEWTRHCALRTDFSRRWALIELDVLLPRTRPHFGGTANNLSRSVPRPQTKRGRHLV